MAKKPTTPPPRHGGQDPGRPESQGGGANKIVVATVVVVVAIIAVVAGVVWSQQSQEKAITGGGNALPTGVAKLGAGYPAFPRTSPPASNAQVVDLYEDFQCPACASFEEALGSTFQEQAQAGKIKLVYHVKNFLDDNLRNDSSTRAANAAFCASDAGKFQEFHNIIFPNQPETEGDGYTDAQLKGFAEQAGITGAALTTWQQCYDANKYVDYVNSVEEQSFADGVRGTPTVKIDGTDVDCRPSRPPRS